MTTRDDLRFDPGPPSADDYERAKRKADLGKRLTHAEGETLRRYTLPVTDVFEGTYGASRAEVRAAALRLHRSNPLEASPSWSLDRVAWSPFGALRWVCGVIVKTEVSSPDRGVSLRIEQRNGHGLAWSNGAIEDGLHRLPAEQVLRWMREALATGAEPIAAQMLEARAWLAAYRASGEPFHDLGAP